MTEFTLHTDKLISKDKIPKNSKLISAELMDYKAKIPGEKILKNCVLFLLKLLS